MARRKPLVYEHLENISRNALEKYQDIIREYVRARCGVYALYRRGKLYYVGLASNLRNRLKQHLKDRHGSSWDRFSVYLTIHDSHLKELESLVLRIVRPEGNKQLGKFTRSVNLQNRLRRDIRDYNRRQLDEVFGRHSGRGVVTIHRGPKGRKKSRRPDLAGCFGRATTLIGKDGDKEFRARVLKTGIIRYRGKKYYSPSEAAAVAKGRRYNGWYFWKYKSQSGEWVRLRTLAK